MKKILVLLGAIVGGALLARRFGRKPGGLSWEQVIDRMPDTAPPKWMFRNITAIRENTDRILELLKSQGETSQTLVPLPVQLTAADLEMSEPSEGAPSAEAGSDDHREPSRPLPRGPFRPIHDPGEPSFVEEVDRGPDHPEP
jgi:hypothetical protein